MQGVGGAVAAGGYRGGPPIKKWGSKLLLFFYSYPEGPKGAPGGQRPPALRRS